MSEPRSISQFLGTVLLWSLLLPAPGCATDERSTIAQPGATPWTGYNQQELSGTVQARPQEPPESAEEPQPGPLRITVEDAVLTALENNRSLVVERLNPEIQRTENNRSLVVERLNPEIRRTFEDEERAEFDPTVEAEVSVGRADSERLTRSVSAAESSRSDEYRGSVFLREFFPTGTFVEAGVTSDTTDSSLYLDPFTQTRLGLSVTQSLLRGYGTDVNLARLRQSRLETDISQYELRGFSESLLAQVEDAYWDYALSLRQIEIVDESLKLARQQLHETEEMIQVGSMAKAELAAVQAEVAVQQQELINAKSAQESSRLRLLRLLNPPGENLWKREVTLVHPPALPEITLGDVETHVAVAFRMRPEINQAELGIRREDLEIVRTRNGLLPRMDLFITLGKSGYADSFPRSVSEMDGGSYDALLGINLGYPIFNRSAGAQHTRALLQRDQAEKALQNLRQLVELDVRDAYIEVNRTKEQISAGTATRKFQEEKLRVETEKFRVGRSTNFFVAQAQRDLLVSRINEVQSVVNYLKALVSFYRLEGSLLVRRGIAAPGAEPVERSSGSLTRPMRRNSP
ncbi:MAG: TolC family protein [Deltaproteobacteria bacterium]|nr:TolC family protein [Deltaproteobacteria bacterium]